MREFFRTEAAKLREMNFTDKRQYIWEYYKLQIIAGVIILIIIGGLINTWFINPPKNNYLYITWQAGHLPSDILDSIAERLNIIVENTDRYQVSVRSYVFTGDPQMDQGLVVRLQALLSIGDVHVTIMDRQELETNLNRGMIRPVDDLISEARNSNPALAELLYEKVEMFNIQYEDDTIVYEAMAINLQDAPLFTELEIITENLYLGIFVTSTRISETLKALAVIFDV